MIVNQQFVLHLATCFLQSKTAPGLLFLRQQGGGSAGGIPGMDQGKAQIMSLDDDNGERVLSLLRIFYRFKRDVCR